MSDDLSIPRPTYRVPRRSRLTPATQRLLIYAGAVVGILALMGGLSLMFERHTGPVPVVEADPRPVRVKPENPGGMQIAGANDPSAGDDKAAKLAPAPEAPNPAALTQAPPAPAAVPAPAVPAPSTAQTGTAQTGAPQTGSAQTGAPTTPQTTAPQSSVAQATAPTVAPPATGKASPSMTSNAGTSNAGTSNAGTATRSTTTQVAAKPAKPVPVPAAAATAEHPSAKGVSHGKATAVQLAALSSEDAAKSEWQRMSRHMPDLLGGRTPTYMKVEHDGHTVWRLRVAGFSDSAQAKAFCEQVHAKRANCAVADF